MIRVQIHGGEELARELRAMSTRVGRSVLRAALLVAGEEIAHVASSMAPREPGAPDLADHIGISNARPRDGSVGIAIGPTTGFYYGYFQEFGTSRHPAQAFMRPAFDSEVRRATQTISGELWRAIVGRTGSRGRFGVGGGGLL